MNIDILNPTDVSNYHRDGYVLKPGLFHKEEVEILGKIAHEDRALDQAANSRDDGNNNPVRLSLWNHPGDGLYGMFARCRRMVHSVELLLQDEAYHYHSKMILKDALKGGAWAWHQDYGYWYQNGVLFPHLCSVMIAVDAATRENGCLEVLRGSHHMGRVNHTLTGDQAGADMERVEEAKKRLEHVYVEMNPGDALFFHGNTLHASAANKSANSRWSLICCYNARSNDPYKDSHHPRYTPLIEVPDEAVLEVGRRRLETGADDGEVDFANLSADDTSATSLAEERHG